MSVGRKQAQKPLRRHCRTCGLRIEWCGETYRHLLTAAGRKAEADHTAELKEPEGV
jgi:hypothetical protein